MKICLPEYGYCVTFNVNGKKRAVCLNSTTISFENKKYTIKDIDDSMIIELTSDDGSVSVSLESLFGQVTDIKREHGLIQGSIGNKEFISDEELEKDIEDRRKAYINNYTFIGEVSSVIKSQLEKVKNWRNANDKK